MFRFFGGGYVEEGAGWKRTCTGFKDRCVVPSPSWPASLSPQLQTVPSFFSARA